MIFLSLPFFPFYFAHVTILPCRVVIIIMYIDLSYNKSKSLSSERTLEYDCEHLYMKEFEKREERPKKWKPLILSRSRLTVCFDIPFDITRKKERKKILDKKQKGLKYWSGVTSGLRNDIAMETEKQKNSNDALII